MGNTGIIYLRNPDGTPGKTWNPTTGCGGCELGEHCWARRYAEGRGRRFFPQGFSHVVCHEDRLDQPLHWRKPQMVGVSFQSDLFHEAVPDEFIAKVFAVMASASQHTFLVLTKRPVPMQNFVGGHGVHLVGDAGIEMGLPPPSGSTLPWWPLPNVWAGVSVEDQPTADERIPLLLDTPAAVRVVSYEPGLGPVDLRPWLKPQMVFETVSSGRQFGLTRKGAKAAGIGLIDWLIVGCESGPGRRRMDVAWVRSLRDQCEAAGVPLFLKQMVVNGRLEHMPALDGRVWDQMPCSKAT